MFTSLQLKLFGIALRYAKHKLLNIFCIVYLVFSFLSACRINYIDFNNRLYCVYYIYKTDVC